MYQSSTPVGIGTRIISFNKFILTFHSLILLFDISLNTYTNNDIPLNQHILSTQNTGMLLFIEKNEVKLTTYYTEDIIELQIICKLTFLVLHVSNRKEHLFCITTRYMINTEIEQTINVDIKFKYWLQKTRNRHCFLLGFSPTYAL